MDKPVLTVGNSFMVKHSTGASILVYSAGVRAPQDLNVCTKTGDTEIRLAPSSVIVNGTTLTWPETFLPVVIPSYKYVLVNSTTGDIGLFDTYQENYALIAIVQTSGSAIERIYNFRDGAKLIFYKKQVHNGLDWEWTGGDTHVLGAGLYPKFSFEDGVLTVLFSKNGSLFKRMVDVEGNIAEFQYKEDYPVNNSIIQPDPFVNINRVSPSAVSSTTVKGYVPYTLGGLSEGSLYNTDGTEEGYYISVPYLVDRAQITLGYSRVDSIQLYDKDIELRQSILPEETGELIKLPSEGSPFYIGFTGAYGVYGSSRFAAAFSLPVEQRIEINPEKETGVIRELAKVGVSCGGGFGITKTLVYVNKLVAETAGVQVSAGGYSMNTKTYHIDTEIIEEEITVGVSCAGSTSIL
jgi:hypothetical protein